MTERKISAIVSLNSLYDTAGVLHVWLENKDGEHLRLDANHLVEKNLVASLPENCFYLKWWGENYRPSTDAVASRWMKIREDIPPASVGGIKVIPVFELLEKQMTKNEARKMVDNWLRNLTQ